tara:strand:+ start:427 stop:630 length:204 start_codon:yes stop_codon:yes gene_type:complete
MRLVLIFLAITILGPLLLNTFFDRTTLLNFERFIDNSIVWILIIAFAFVIVFFLLKARDSHSGDDGL